MSFGSILRANYTETLGRAGRDHKIGNRIFFDRNLLRQSVLVQLRQGRPPAIFPRFEMSADERRLAVQNSAFIFVTPALRCGQTCEPFSPQITRIALIVP